MVFTSGNIEFSQTNPEKSFNLFICCFWKPHSRHLFIQNPQPNYYNNMWNLFKVSDRDARKTSWCRVFMYFIPFSSYHGQQRGRSVVVIVNFKYIIDFEKQVPPEDALPHVFASSLKFIFICGIYLHHFFKK